MQKRLKNTAIDKPQRVSVKACRELIMANKLFFLGARGVSVNLSEFRVVDFEKAVLSFESSFFIMMCPLEENEL